MSCLTALFFTAALVLAQATSSLSGIVSDPTGAVIAGATITLTHTGSGLSRKTASNERGVYQFVQLPPGTYTLRAEQTGFKTLTHGDVELRVNVPTTLDLQFTEAGQIVETVEVAGEALINKTDASVGNAIGELQIRQLPSLGRNIVAFLAAQPGAVFVPTGDIRSGSINGSRSDQTNVTMDGVDVNDPQFGFAYTSVLRATLDSVQEFRVTTTNYGANQGRSSAAQASLVTKRGTNEIHGSAYWYHRNTATSANEYFLKLTQIESGQPNKQPKLNWHIFGASGSAPIIKNRWFVFANYEGFRQKSEASISRAVPSMLFRNGYLQYRCSVASQCPASTVTVGGRTFNIPAGIRALSPQQVATVEPLGIGSNPAVQAHFQRYPEPNDPGRDGLNIVGFRFPSPIKDDQNTAILRTDFNIDRAGKHTLFWRGNLQDDTADGSQQFPGQPPNNKTLVNPKGFAMGYDAVLSPNLTNAFRWGYTRIKTETAGLQQLTQVTFRFIDNLPAQSRSSGRTVPTHNFVNDLSWLKGAHAVQTGANIRFTRIPRFSQDNSFHGIITNGSWLLGVGRFTAPGHVRCTQPGCSTLPAVASGFLASWADSVTPLLGLITQFTGLYNYDKAGNVLAEGAPIVRRYATNEYEGYVQDTWRVKSNLTVSMGVRYALYSPPWETNGLQVKPVPSFGEFVSIRRANMARGIPSNDAPRISFDLAGPANDRPGFYEKDFNNWAPRFSVAWTPRGFLRPLFGDGRTVFRLGYGLVYDRIGHALATTFDAGGSFGMSTNLTNPASTLTEATAPRFTGLNSIPRTDRTGATVLRAAPPGGFPQTPPFGLFAITSSIDDTIKTPYAHTINFFIGRELPRNFVVEVGYVGRRGRTLLTRRDLAMPLDLVDQRSGMSYFQAATALAKLVEANTPVSAVRPIPFWENIFPTAGARAGGGLSNTQAIYQVFRDNAPDYTTALFEIDFACSPACAFGTASNPGGRAFSFFSDQYSALAGQSTIGYSEYHAFQFITRKRFSGGTQFDFNYTLSKSLDLTSGTERGGSFGSFNNGGYSDFIVNAWSPRLNYGLSDFDFRHQVNANYVVELPFGRGKPLGGSVPGWANHVIGGWQTTGILRWSSGQTASIFNCRSCWPTNWNLQGNAELKDGLTAYPEGKTNKNYRFPDGRVRPALFENPGEVLKMLRFGRPGEVGFRNKIRGDGYVALDFGLMKSFAIYESHRLQFRWEIFNLTNTVRFNTGALDSFPDISNSFGRYTGTLTSPRIMQFAFRYEF
jgi:hypothetical protein